MKLPRIALVGCGSIARKHAKNLQAQTELVFCSRDLARAKSYANEHKAVGASCDYESLLSDKNIDAVILCSPPELHLSQSLLALEAGKALMVEKPLCISPTEVEQIEKALQKSKSLFMVAENYYYKPSFVKLRQFIQRGLIGELRRLKIQKELTQQSRTWKAGYGALLEGGIHFVALMNGLVERKAMKLRAEIPDNEDIERSSSLLVEYEGQIQAQLRYAWNRPALFKGLFQHSVIEGSSGELIFESNGMYILYRSYRAGVPAFIPFLSDIAGYKAMMKNFLNAIAGTEEVFSNFERAKRDLSLVFDAYQLNDRNAVGQRLK